MITGRDTRSHDRQDARRYKSCRRALASPPVLVFYFDWL